MVQQLPEPGLTFAEAAGVHVLTNCSAGSASDTADLSQPLRGDGEPTSRQVEQRLAPSCSPVRVLS